jgi:hypothetical protein
VLYIQAEVTLALGLAKGPKTTKVCQGFLLSSVLAVAKLL